MINKLPLIATTALMMAAGISEMKAQNITINDANFKASLLEMKHDVDGNGTLDEFVDKNRDGQISQTEATNAGIIDFRQAHLTTSNFSAISDLSALQYFPNIDTLHIGIADLSHIDAINIDNNTKLKLFSFSSTAISTVNLSNNTELIDIRLAGNTAMTSIDLSNNRKLKTINISESKITALDLSGMPEFGDAFVNQTAALTTLNLSNCPKLKGVNVFENTGLTSIDLTGSDNIADLYIYDNTKLKTLTLPSDLSKVEKVNMRGKAINNADGDLTGFDSVLDLASIDFSNNTVLTTIAIQGNKLQTMNLSGCTSLTEVFAHDNDFTTINITGATSIETLDLSSFDNSGKLTTLNLSDASSLEDLKCQGNQITTIDFSGAVVLSEFNINSNKLTTLDLSKSTSLYVFYANDNDIESVIVPEDIGAFNFAVIELKNNNLTSLDLSAITGGEGQEFNFTGNPDLSCIKMNSEQVADDASDKSNGYGLWFKDTTTEYSDSCETASVNDAALVSNVTIFPNPANTQLNVATRNGVEVVSAVLVSVQGNVVADVANNNNISGIAPGVYVLKVQTNQGAVQQKVIIE